MRSFLTLTKRNCKIYFKDRPTVLFSLLSMFIVLMLMAVFLGDMNVENITEMLAEYGGARDAALDRENAEHLVQYWTLAGIMMVNAVMVTLTVIGNMVNDASENRLGSFSCAPVSGFTLSLSYIAAAVLTGSLACLITMAAALCYIALTGGALLSFAAILQVLGYSVVNAAVFAVILYAVALPIKSSGAWSGLGTIIGTLVGFVGAIYLPMGTLPEAVGNVLKFLPFLHGTSLIRKVCCEAAMETTFQGLPAEFSEVFQEEMGITVTIGENTVGSAAQLLFLLGFGLIALAVIAVLTKKRKAADR